MDLLVSSGHWISIRRCSDCFRHSRRWQRLYKICLKIGLKLFRKFIENTQMTENLIPIYLLGHYFESYLKFFSEHVYLVFYCLHVYPKCEDFFVVPISPSQRS